MSSWGPMIREAVAVSAGHGTGLRRRGDGAGDCLGLDPGCLGEAIADHDRWHPPERPGSLYLALVAEVWR